MSDFKKSEFQMQRLGLVIEPEPGNPDEVEGILNPAVTRGLDGLPLMSIMQLRNCET